MWKEKWNWSGFGLEEMRIQPFWIPFFLYF